jgi:hypothetical protein
MMGRQRLVSKKNFTVPSKGGIRQEDAGYIYQFYQYQILYTLEKSIIRRRSEL